MNRPLLALGASAIALALLLAFALRRTSETEAVGIAHAPSSAAPAPALLQPSIEGSATAAPEAAVREAPVAQREASGARTAAAATASESVPLAQLRGRVLDERGAPIEGAHVELTSIGRWRNGVEAVRFDWRGRRRIGYATASNAAGEFELEVPVPTADSILLRIEGDALHAVGTREFGSARERMEPPLVAGPNEVGDVQLELSSCVRGRVRDAAGQAVANARARIGAEASSSEQSAPTDAEGRFQIEHVRAGRWFVWADAGKALTVEPVQIELAAGAPSEELVLELRAAPSIDGIVVDDSGAPLRGVLVRGTPVDAGAESLAQTGSDGRFVLFLARNSAHSIETEHDGYENVGGQGSTAPISPGAPGLLLVLHRRGQFEFRVLDARTGAAIERFGLAAVDAPDPRELQAQEFEALPIAAAPGGLRALAIDPERQWILCEAPGHAPLESAIIPDEAGGSRQTLRMEPGGSIRGEVAGVERPKLRLRQQGSRIDASKPELSDFLGRARHAIAAADGSFEFADLASGTYELDITSTGRAPTRLRDLKVLQGRVLELGELALAVGATVEGRVMLAPGRSAAELVLRLEGASSDRQRTLGIDGAFRFEDLPSGEHRLVAEDRTDVCVQAEPLALTLATGEHRSIDLELARFCAARLRVRATQAGQAIGDLAVEWSGGGARGVLGKTDSEGRCEGFVRAGTALQLGLRAADGSMVAKRSIALSTAAGTVEALEIELDCGGCRVELDPAIELPPDGGLVLFLENLDAHESAFRSFCLAEPCPSADDAWPAERVIEFRQLLPGSWTARLQSFRLNAAGVPESRELAHGAFTVAARHSAKCALTASR